MNQKNLEALSCLIKNIKRKSINILLNSDVDSKDFSNVAGASRVLNYSNKSSKDRVLTYQYEGSGGIDTSSPLHNPNKKYEEEFDDDGDGGGANENRKTREVRSISVDGYEHLVSTELAKRTPWMNFFTHKESLTLFFMSWSAGFVNFMLLSEMPSYLTSQLGFDIVTSGALCVVPYASLFCTTLGFGKLFDYLQHHKAWQVRTIRQIAQFIAVGGSAIVLLICGFVPEKFVYVCYGCMVVSQALIGLYKSFLVC